MVRATRYSHQLNPVFTPPMRRLLRSLGTATLATVDDARVGPRLLESEGSGCAFLGRYHSGIYRDSRLNRHTNDTEDMLFPILSVHRRAHLARLHGRAAKGCAREITSIRLYNDFVLSPSSDPAEFLMMALDASVLFPSLRQPSGSSTRLCRQKLPLGQHHRLSVRTGQAHPGLDRSN